MINKISAVSFKGNNEKIVVKGNAPKNEEQKEQLDKKASSFEEPINAFRVYQERIFKNQKDSISTGGAIILTTALSALYGATAFGKGKVLQSAATGLFASAFATGIQNTIKGREEAKEYAKKYDNQEQAQKRSWFSKIVHNLAFPQALNFKTEEENKEYFDKELRANKQDVVEALAHSLVGVTFAVLHRAIESARKVAKKENPIYTFVAGAILSMGALRLFLPKEKQEKVDKFFGKVADKI